MSTSVLRPTLALILAAWTMVACGGGGSALGVGGGPSSPVPSGLAGEANPLIPSPPDGEVSPEVASCPSASSGYLESESGPSFNMDYGNFTMVDDSTANDPEPKRYSFSLKMNDIRQIIACTFTAEIDGTFRDFSLVDGKLHWEQ